MKNDLDRIEISVILPAYNSERYIEKSVRSVLAQEGVSFELIIVDDCSTDGTYALCKTIAERDKRVVLHRKKTNGGVCTARNAGLRIARGTYIAFCDNDDVMRENALRDNLRFAKEHGLDIVKWNYLTFEDDTGRVVKRDMKNAAYADRRAMFRDYKNLRLTLDTVWNGLYRRELIERYRVRFDETMRFGGEDLYFDLLLLKHPARWGINEHVYYEWHVRSWHSTSGKHNENLCRSMIKNARLETLIAVKNIPMREAVGCLTLIRDDHKGYILLNAGQVSDACKKKYRRILCFEWWTRTGGLILLYRAVLKLQRMLKGESRQTGGV